MEYKYTAEMEKKLDDIASGSLDHLNMLKEFFYPFKEQLKQAYVSNGSSVCDKCGAPMIMRTNSKDNSRFLACSAYPKCRNTKAVS
jgi:DNA topoisomerase-1